MPNYYNTSKEELEVSYNHLFLANELLKTQEALERLKKFHLEEESDKKKVSECISLIYKLRAELYERFNKRYPYLIVGKDYVGGN